MRRRSRPSPPAYTAPAVGVRRGNAAQYAGSRAIMLAARAVSGARRAGGQNGEVADSAHAYAELRQAVIAEGWLERAYDYYAWRSGLSVLLLGVGFASALVLPGPVWIGLSSVV